MKWSFYKAKTFNRCQRKWYYSEIEASHSKKDADRREIYLLKQLQSVPAWIGSVVDTISGHLCSSWCGYRNRISSLSPSLDGRLLVGGRSQPLQPLVKTLQPRDR